MKKLTIIGGGPAALMLAAQLDRKKYDITLYDKKKAVGRKFLVAGEGGLNLTYSSALGQLIAQYAPSGFMDSIISEFTNTDLIQWLNDIGVPTFVGSSNRVFPHADLKPIEVLNKIVEHIFTNPIKYKLDTEWKGWNSAGYLTFDGADDIDSDIVVFALGGASWKVTGSDGSWRNIFVDRGVEVVPFSPANCAFRVDWKKDFLSAHAGRPLKNIAMTYDGLTARGELVISRFGLEGNAIYALSQKIQEALYKDKSTVVYLDLKPTMTVDQIKAKYKKSTRTKVTDILSNDLNLDRTSIGLIKQFTDRDTFMNPDLLAAAIKAVPITIHGADELDKAISTLGGIRLDAIDDNFQLKNMPNTYAIGEMLDWYAPTGGYLLQGCFSMGYVLAEHLNGLED